MEEIEKLKEKFIVDHPEVKEQIEHIFNTAKKAT